LQISTTEVGYSTFDSTTAIQNAYNSLNAGGVLLIPPGVYNFTNLTLNKTEIEIMGYGRLKSILNYKGSGAYALKLSNTAWRTSMTWNQVRLKGLA
jgi:hypothetical protein